MHSIKLFSATLILCLTLCCAEALAQTGNVNQKALENLIRRAGETHSDALVVLKNGRPVGEWYFGREKGKIQLMSATKSVVNLIIGKLIDTGKIKSLDQPVYEFYPEWNQGRKKSITVRHLLNHTSGLQDIPNAGVELEPAPDVVKLALAAELSEEPGQKFRYNNKAVNLLAGIVEIASGKRMDIYFRDEILQPMGITDYNWLLDRSGNPYVMAGLELSATDFAKIGQLVLNKGLWEGKRIIGEKWIEESLAQGQPHFATSGLLWWRMPSYQRFVIDAAKLNELEAASVSREFINKILPLKGNVFSNRQEFNKALEKTLGSNWSEAVHKEVGSKNIQLPNRITGDIIGNYAEGFLGQHLVLMPQHNLVAVRLVRRSKSYNFNTDVFEDFRDIVRSLVE
ncbi:MAG TPA: serine hydrolase [Pyrinomonadaceae bacterium]